MGCFSQNDRLMPRSETLSIVRTACPDQGLQSLPICPRRRPLALHERLDCVRSAGVPHVASDKSLSTAGTGPEVGGVDVQSSAGRRQLVTPLHGKNNGVMGAHLAPGLPRLGENRLLALGGNAGCVE